MLSVHLEHRDQFLSLAYRAAYAHPGRFPEPPAYGGASPDGGLLRLPNA